MTCVDREKLRGKLIARAESDDACPIETSRGRSSTHRLHDVLFLQEVDEHFLVNESLEQARVPRTTPSMNRNLEYSWYIPSTNILR